MEITDNPKLREFLELEKKVHDHWVELVRISLDAARERGIEIEIISSGSVVKKSNNRILIYQEGDRVHTDALLELAEDRDPLLYNEYYKAKQRYEEMKKKLKVA